MTSLVELPLQARPQRFRAIIGGLGYRFTVQWCDPAQAWRMDVSNDAGEALVNGLMLVTGCDIVEQFAYLGFNFKLAAYTDHAPEQVPTFENLGATGHVVAAVP